MAPSLARAPRLLLALDFDGTLSPIVPRPEEARLLPQARTPLAAMARHPRCRVAIITGRSLADIRPRVGVEGVIYGGNYGLEMEVNGERWAPPQVEGALPALRAAARALRERLDGLPGVFLEDKGLSLSVHYRRARGPVKEEARRRCREALEPLLARGEVRASPGREVVEVLPALPWDKGECLRHLLRRLHREGEGPPLGIVLGDDTSDEPAFRAVMDAGGFAIRVGRPRRDSCAPFFLRSPVEVARFLGRLVDLLAQGPPAERGRTDGVG